MERLSSMPGLCIGVNALYLIPGGVGGTEIYLRSLLASFAETGSENRYVVFTNLETGTDLAPRRPAFTTHVAPIRATFRPGRILWEQTALPFEADRHGIDVLFNPGFTAPIVSRCPMVTVFHDLQHKRHPEYFRWFDLPFWRFLLWASARRSRILLADSEATRSDLLAYYRLRPEKVRTVMLGVDQRFFDLGGERLSARLEPYLLAVSTLHPHKNLERLIRAYAAFRRRRPEFRLVIAGLRGFHTEVLERLVASLQLADSVRFTGWVPREELHRLYLHATAFLYPTTFEGFGLPVLEALAAGIPTGCSAIEPVRTTAGEAALQFDPEDEGAIAAAMERLVADEALRERLAAAGPARAAEFSWRKTAEATLAAIREAASPLRPA